MREKNDKQWYLILSIDINLNKNYKVDWFLKYSLS